MRKHVNNTKCEKLISEVKSKCFIKGAIEKEKAMGHEGLTHKLLNIPVEYNLSHAETLLQKIVDTPLGVVAKNPLVIGKKSYKVTKELKAHANFALNLIRISEGKYKK